MADVVYDGNDGLEYGKSGIYDLIILDIMLPFKDGFQVAFELRQSRINTPILMLTAKDTVPDKVSGLNCGADDYKRPPEKFGKKRRDNLPSQLNSYIMVSVDNEGNILSKQESNATIDDDILNKCINTAIINDNQVGEIEKYNLTYTKNVQIERTVIVFADNSRVYSTLRNIILVCVGLFIASMAVLFLISLALSGIAVNPVKDA